MHIKSFQLDGLVVAVLIAPNVDSIITRPVKKIEFLLGYGVRGDRHFGPVFRLADVRERGLKKHGIPKGTPIADDRQVSAIFVESSAVVAKQMGLPREIPPGLYGENIIFQGVPDPDNLPRGARFYFENLHGEKRTSVLEVTAANEPCEFPDEEIRKYFADTVPTIPFQTAAFGRRGLVFRIIVSGLVKPGDKVVIEVPEQKSYNPLDFPTE